jgi:hypothetical protein
MQPLTGMPPMPSGRNAVDAWRTLDRETRQRLLGGESAPDSTIAVIAVGYARTVLARSPRRRLWPLLAVMICAIAVLTAADVISGTSITANPVARCSTWRWSSHCLHDQAPGSAATRPVGAHGERERLPALGN